MVVVYTLVVQATWEQRAITFAYACSEGIFSIPGLLTAAKNLSNATAPNSLINSLNTALILKHGHLQKRTILQFILRKINARSLSRLLTIVPCVPSPFITHKRPRSCTAKGKPITIRRKLCLAFSLVATEGSCYKFKICSLDDSQSNRPITGSHWDDNKK